MCHALPAYIELLNPKNMRPLTNTALLLWRRDEAVPVSALLTVTTFHCIASHLVPLYLTHVRTHTLNITVGAKS